VSIELDRITYPLRLAKGSHKPGSGKGCAMNVISYINGDVEITDFPKCSARPLARMVQELNDGLADEDGYLSPKNSVLVLDLGWRTVGTAGAPREVVLRWLAELLIDPVHGVVQHVRWLATLLSNPGYGVTLRVISRTEKLIGRVADLLLRDAAGEPISAAEWQKVRDASPAASFLAYAISCATKLTGGDESGAKKDAACAAVGAATFRHGAPRIEFTRWAIEKWRELAKLDDPQPITADEINKALEQIGLHA